MSVWSILICMLVGFIIGFAAFWALFEYNYTEHGGSILMDLKTGVYRLILNDDVESWQDAKWVILKVTKKEQKLKRLEDIPDEPNLNLEDQDEWKN